MHWVGLVRNVMLGRDGLTRDVLLDVVGDAGGLHGRSHLTTGNVTFHAPPEELDTLVERLENGIGQILGRREICAVRRMPWLHGLVAQDRFQHFNTDWETEVAFLRHDAPVIDRNRIGDPRRTVLRGRSSAGASHCPTRSGGGRPHVNSLLEHGVAVARDRARLVDPSTHRARIAAVLVGRDTASSLLSSRASWQTRRHRRVRRRNKRPYWFRESVFPPVLTESSSSRVPGNVRSRRLSPPCRRTATQDR